MNHQLQAKQAYAESSILTASPERLIVMLYDGAIRFLRQAAHAMREGTPEQASDRLARANAILTELNCALDVERGGEVAERLRMIYLFCKRHTSDANLRRDPAGLDAVVKLLTELRESWAKVADQAAVA
ncbi:MAG: flagellar export chaperone FliS [Gaiellaceae bacterium]